MQNKDSLSPLEQAREREKRLIEGLKNLAAQYGKEVQPIHSIDANGEVMFAIKNPEDPSGLSCGEFGKDIAYYQHAP